MPPPRFPPPPGYRVEGIHGESSGPRMLVASGITLGLAIMALVLRMIVKGSIVHSTSWEDYLASAALLLAIARTTIFILLVKYHQFGQHVWDFERSNLNALFTWTKGGALIYLAAIACAKISILLLYIRLFGVNRPFRNVCYALMALVTGYCTALILANIFQCSPIHAGWDFFAPGHCASLIKINIAIGGFNILTDFAIVVAPIPLVLGLQLRHPKMVGLLAIFATGFFVVAVAILREVEVVRSPNSYDATWAEAARELWLSVELNVGIICTSLPLLSPLSRKWPGIAYFRDQYHSMVSLIRGGRSKSRGSASTSQIVPPGSETGDYIPLGESGRSKMKARENFV